MYLEHYGLSEKPFNITPNPRFVFLSKNHREVFAHLLYGIRQHAGFIEVTGEVGTGKTTVLRSLFRELEKEHYRFAYIFNPSLAAVELLRAVNREFGLPEVASAGELHAALNTFLLQENAAGRTVVLVIDEAQNLEPAVLEQVRLLSNLETETDKLIQIILVGQPELGALLSRPELRQLSQRITVRYHLRPMDHDDTVAYILHRLTVAGWKRRPLFTAKALELVYRKTHGNPRLTNILCDRALLVGFAEETAQIGRTEVRRAAREMQRECGGNVLPRRLGWLIGAGALLLLALWLTFGPEPSSSARPALPSVSVPEPDRFREQFLPVLQGEARQQTAAAAVGAVLRSWGGVPLAGSAEEELEPLLNRTRDQGFEVARLSGERAALEQLALPAILELSLDGDLRYLTLLSLSGEQVHLALAVGGQTDVAWAQVAPYWTGRAYLLWRNPLKISASKAPLHDSVQVDRLQRLLGQAGIAVPHSSQYDEATSSAIRTFQRSRNLKPDGIAGVQTLICLYRASGRYNYPQLTQGEGGER